MRGGSASTNAAAGQWPSRLRQRWKVERENLPQAQNRTAVVARAIEVREDRGSAAMACRHDPSVAEGMASGKTGFVERTRMKPSRWSGSRDWSPACMAASASSRHSTRRPVVTPSSRLSASRVSPRRSRRTTSVLRRLDHRPLSCRSPSAVPLAPLACCAAEGCLCRGFLVVPCIVSSSPKRVSQETMPRTTKVRLFRQWNCSRAASMAAMISTLSPSGIKPETILRACRFRATSTA